MNPSRRDILCAGGAIAVSPALRMSKVHAEGESGCRASSIPNYSQAMGATDGNGFVVKFPLQDDGVATRMWINTELGDDNNFNGLSPYPGYRLNGVGKNFQYGATGKGLPANRYGPKSTYLGGYTALSDDDALRAGHQIFLAEGQNFTEGASAQSLNFSSGKSVEFPRCLQSYDPEDPLNEYKHGRAEGAKRPKLSTAVTNGVGKIYGTVRFYRTDNPQGPPRGNFVFRGLSFDSNTFDGCEVTWVGNPYNVLFENCVFPGCGLGVGSSNPASNAKNVIFRHCSVWGNFASSGAHSAGIGSGHVDGMVIEDCIVYHAGWPIGVTRDIKGPTAPDIFKQGMYLSYGSADQTILRRCVIMDASHAGASGRGSLRMYHCVLIDNPVAAEAGGNVQNYSIENPTGVDFNYDRNLIMGSANVNAATIRNIGVIQRNGRIGSGCTYNLFVNNNNYGNALATMFKSMTKYNQPSHCELKGNRGFHYAPQSLLDSPISSSPYPSQVLTTYSDNECFPDSPMTNDEIYAALGFSSKQQLIDEMLDTPEQAWAYRFLRVAQTGFNFDFALGG